MGIPVQYLLKRLWERHPIKINRQTIWRNYQWSKLASRGFHLIAVYEIRRFLNKIRIHRFDNKLGEMGLKDIMYGVKVFSELEPKAAYEIYKTIDKFVTQQRIYEITGIDKDPDVSDLE